MTIAVQHRANHDIEGETVDSLGSVVVGSAPSIHQEEEEETAQAFADSVQRESVVDKESADDEKAESDYGKSHEPANEGNRNYQKEKGRHYG